MRTEFYPSESAKKELLEMFNKSGIFEGATFLWMSILDKNGQSYGSYKYIKQIELKDRRYVIERCDGKPAITMLDTVYDIKLGYAHAYHKLSTFAKRNRLRHKRKIRSITLKQEVQE